jgi:signal transduction histidine kinase
MTSIDRLDIAPELRELIERAGRGRPGRLGFATMGALTASFLVSPIAAAVWLALVFAWELWGSDAVDRAFVLQPDGSDLAARKIRLGWTTRAIGAVLFALFPTALALTNDPAGLFMAMIWITGSAMHVFIFITRRPHLVLTHIAPSLIGLAYAIAATRGADPSAWGVFAVATLAIIPAAIVMADRVALMDQLNVANAARDAALHVSEEKTALLARMSHELKTPLNAIINYSEILRDDVLSGAAPALDDAERITAAARRLLAVVNDVIDMSRLDAGALELATEPVEIAQLLDDVALDAAPAAREKGVRFEAHAQNAIGRFVLDRVRVRQCLRAMADALCRGAQGPIAVTAREENGRLVFVGADPARHQREAGLIGLFEPFAQTDGHREAAEPGLGLALARALARRMGGDLVAASTPASGLTLTFEIPANAAITPQ